MMYVHLLKLLWGFLFVFVLDLFWIHKWLLMTLPKFRLLFVVHIISEIWSLDFYPSCLVWKINLDLTSFHAKLQLVLPFSFSALAFSHDALNNSSYYRPIIYWPCFGGLFLVSHLDFLDLMYSKTLWKLQRLQPHSTLLFIYTVETLLSLNLYPLI